MTAPNPPPPAYVRSLCDQVGGQRAAARLIRVDERTMRRWCAVSAPSSAPCPWAAAELLRRMAAEQAGADYRPEGNP